MCTSNNFPAALVPYGMKLHAPVPGLGAPYPSALPPGAALELQRSHAAQLYDYGARIRLGLQYAAAAAGQPSFPGYPHGPHDPFGLMYAKHCDPRVRFLHEEPKPSHSYIGLIAMAILSVKDKKMVLSDIYQWILDNYAYFRSRGPGWRNSIRHNLSLNDCFVKQGRSANGKGHYWMVHGANVTDFTRGDFRRRRAQRKVRKAMGLTVPDDEDSPSPSPSPTPQADCHWASHVPGEDRGPMPPGDTAPGSPLRSPADHTDGNPGEERSPLGSEGHLEVNTDGGVPRFGNQPPSSDKSPSSLRVHHSRKRLFDVDSLLAPDGETEKRLKFSETEAVPRYNPLQFPGGLPPAHLFHHHRQLLQSSLTPVELQKSLLVAAAAASAAAAHPSNPFAYTAANVAPTNRDQRPRFSEPLEIDTTADSDLELDVESSGPPLAPLAESKADSERLTPESERGGPCSSRPRTPEHNDSALSTALSPIFRGVGDHDTSGTSPGDREARESQDVKRAGFSWLPLVPRGVWPGSERVSAFHSGLAPHPGPSMMWPLGAVTANPSAMALVAPKPSTPSSNSR